MPLLLSATKLEKKKKNPLHFYSTFLCITQAVQFIWAWKAGLDTHAQKDKQILEGQHVLPVLLRPSLKRKVSTVLSSTSWRDGMTGKEGQGHVSRQGNTGRKHSRTLLSAVLLITQVLIQINTVQVNRSVRYLNKPAPKRLFRANSAFGYELKDTLRSHEPCFLWCYQPLQNTEQEGRVFGKESFLPEPPTSLVLRCTPPAPHTAGKGYRDPLLRVLRDLSEFPHS